MFMSREPVSELPLQGNSLAGKTIDSLEFAKAGRELSGRLMVASMSRLHDVLVDDAGSVDVVLVGELDDQRRPWLHLEVRGELGLVCQRCLGRMAHVLEIDSHLRLIRPGEPWPEDELEEGGDADDAVAAEEALSLLSLVEEEIVLALPYAPMHEACELPGEGKLNGKASPFAALAVLKKH